MWFLPSYGRPNALKAMVDAGHELPSDLVVILNEDDPTKDQYWVPCGAKIHYAPAGSRVGDVWRQVYIDFPQEAFYGLGSDDYVCQKPGSWDALAKIAADRYIAKSVGMKIGTSVLCLGGNLVRAVDTLAPAALTHNFVDNVWITIGEDFGIIRECPDAVIEHKHPVHDSSVPMDATYKRNDAYFAEDQRRFEKWYCKERLDTNGWVAHVLGINPLVMTADLSKVKLAICLPLADGRIDVGLDESLCSNLEVCVRHGMRFSKHVIQGGSNIGITRELLMNSALASDATHIMFVDDDMLWDDHELIARLIASDHDFTGVAGCRKTPGKVQFCCRFLPDPQVTHDRSGFLKVRDVGFGLVIIRREVFERMIAAYPKLAYDAVGSLEAGYALFCETIQIDPVSGKRIRLGEDTAFCWRWTAIGGEIWIDQSAELKHVGRFDYTGKLADTLEPEVPQIIMRAAE